MLFSNDYSSVSSFNLPSPLTVVVVKRPLLTVTGGISLQVEDEAGDLELDNMAFLRLSRCCFLLHRGVK